MKYKVGDIIDFNHSYGVAKITHIVEDCYKLEYLKGNVSRGTWKVSTLDRYTVLHPTYNTELYKALND